jgi:hypothetical protein
MQIKFEHDYRNKLMNQSFSEPFTFKSKTDVLMWRSRWTQELKSWHSPYKCMIDFSQVSVDESNPDLKEAFEAMLRFLNGFFLRKAVGFGLDPSKNHSILPFDVEESEEQAAAKLGIRERQKTTPGDFRSSIQFENHFRQHVVEMSFSAPVKIDSKEKIATIKSKLMNNLMQWHSAWNLLVDCTEMEFEPEFKNDFMEMTEYFKGFFLKFTVGYSPKSKQDNYPFKAYRSRHKAVALLENEGMISGEDANCASRK